MRNVSERIFGIMIRIRSKKADPGLERIYAFPFQKAVLIR